MIPHAAVTNMAMSTIDESGAGPDDTVLQYATSSFDVSVLEIFTALASGARMVVPSSEVVLSPPALTRLMQAEGVTFVDIPPAVLELLPAQAFPALRFQLIGGEAFSGPLATRWQAPGRRTFNGYGPTEATVMMTLMELDGAYDQQPPIGFPMPNHQVYVLDPWMQPVPVGVAGEMYIGGAGLARGYLDRPDLTAERFVPNPFGAPGSRLYRTGDRARLRDDEALEFLGRLDGQVKIRGYRIEIGEIETVLTGFPSVQQAVVVVHEDPRGTKQLVAYVLIDRPPSPPSGELRAWLGQRLPSYMVPSTIVPVDEFPLLASGKVDRTKLPDPAGVPGYVDDAYAPPRNDLELAVVTVFALVLGVDRVGIHDNFFERGGNSLQMAEVQSGLREALDVEVPLRSLFQASSPAQLADHLASVALVTATAPEDAVREEGEL
jgi:acyl-coenzyme A synthetase/AMP-(fatty) acid ligase/acyl carrier protein